MLQVRSDMNKRIAIKQMKKFINENGRIIKEYKRPRDSFYTSGSYFAVFESEELDTIAGLGNVDKYSVYKRIVEEIKGGLRENERSRKEGV